MKIVPASDSSLLIVLGDSISVETHERVMAFFHAAQELADPRIRNIHPAYTTVLIDFDPLRLSHDEATALAQRLASEPQEVVRKPACKPQLVIIPVCYDAEFGPDLDDVAKHADVSREEVIRLHSSVTYIVHFLGFSPGFSYLGGLPDALHIPRLATPRKHVAAGSVAIAGGQAGVYPVDSPGGWRLIGRTPVQMFNPRASDPTALHPGEHVEFQAIDRATFDRMAGGAAESGR
jgi:KipI family sensor histidine kinase inhibitor